MLAGAGVLAAVGWCGEAEEVAAVGGGGEPEEVAAVVGVGEEEVVVIEGGGRLGGRVVTQGLGHW